MKMKAAVHLLRSIVDVRDQKSGSDIPVLFGLLCICYGAGPSMIEVLQHLGLSESYPTLIGILKGQLDHYKDIISQRCPKDMPVITYQDNLQMQRSSLRHLRLSKLEKEKYKQEKLWDFTMRGWRKANVDGIEDLFLKKETAVKPQGDVSTLQYADTLIESNPVHSKKWSGYRLRNTLMKLDLGLNKVRMSSSELIGATAEELQKKANEEEVTPKPFKINVPSPDEEFPHLRETKTDIYPLPMSHENQCSLMGTAVNLDIFSDEFGFPVEERKMFLPLKYSAKEFDLDRAYERFAFMKSLEMHKLQQKDYEQFLRRVGETSDRCDEDSLQPIGLDDENEISSD